jgi:UDP-glucose 4-epimerase
MTAKRILITGPLGHIGSRFIHDIKHGDFEEVILVDNLSTQRYCSLFNLPQSVPFRFMEADIFEVNLETLCKGVDVVLHLAAITDAANSFEIADRVERMNYGGTEKVAKACAVNNCRLIFISTTSVYGTQDELVDENCGEKDLKPQSPYAESKLKAEKLLHQMGETDGLKYIICRFGTIFGTSIGMRFHTAINKFCWQAINGLPITVWRTALDQKRPYLHLSDAISAIRFILQKDLFDNQIYNVLTANASVRQITEIINRHIRDVNIQLVDAAIMNQLSYNVLNDKFQQQGFKFQADLEEGIAETLNLLKGLHRDGKD